ncbi:MAG: hypothetical protein HY515_00245, partial [Candidatus Aenigmarchaeota archaeon]|nr:hypothetical protein [Candidatus Aenigmarchaeota archaeon]
DGNYINIDEKLLNKGGWDSDVILNDKIMIRQTGDRIYASLDTQKYYHLNNIHSFNLKNSILDTRYILAILNSNILSSYYLLTTLEKHRAMAQTDIETLEKLPIKESSKLEQQPFIKLVDKIISLNIQLQEIGDIQTSHRQELEVEKDKTNTQIDDLVYKLYGITEEEKKVIEESLK